MAEPTNSEEETPFQDSALVVGAAIVAVFLIVVAMYALRKRH
jgi:hypothetical protein